MTAIGQTTYFPVLNVDLSSSLIKETSSKHSFLRKKKQTSTRSADRAIESDPLLLLLEIVPSAKQGRKVVRGHDRRRGRARKSAPKAGKSGRRVLIGRLQQTPPVGLLFFGLTQPDDGILDQIEQGLRPVAPKSVDAGTCRTPSSALEGEQICVEAVAPQALEGPTNGRGVFGAWGRQVAARFAPSRTVSNPVGPTAAVSKYGQSARLMKEEFLVLDFEEAVILFLAGVVHVCHFEEVRIEFQKESSTGRRGVRSFRHQTTHVS